VLNGARESQWISQSGHIQRVGQRPKMDPEVVGGLKT